MVIGNGFFSENKEAALKEMQERSKCEVRHLPYPTIGNIDYLISRKGDLYGMQRIAGRYIIRKKSHLRYKHGFTARLVQSAHKEIFIRLQVLVWSAFVANRWEPDVELEFVNGDCCDVRPENLRIKHEAVPTEYAERMEQRKGIYEGKFVRVCWSVNLTTGLSMEDCKDVVQNTFIYLTTSGHRPCIQTEDDFIGVWIKVARLRAIDYIKHRWFEHHWEMDWLPARKDKGYEFDWFKLQPGEKRQTYLRMFFEGNRPTEIANACGVSLGTVSSNITRSVQFMQKYFKKDIERWNHC